MLVCDAERVAGFNWTKHPGDRAEIRSPIEVGVKPRPLVRPARLGGEQGRAAGIAATRPGSSSPATARPPGAEARGGWRFRTKGKC